MKAKFAIALTVAMMTPTLRAQSAPEKSVQLARLRRPVVGEGEAQPARHRHEGPTVIGVLHPDRYPVEARRRALAVLEHGISAELRAWLPTLQPFWVYCYLLWCHAVLVGHLSKLLIPTT